MYSVSFLELQKIKLPHHVGYSTAVKLSTLRVVRRSENPGVTLFFDGHNRPPLDEMQTCMPVSFFAIVTNFLHLILHKNRQFYVHFTLFLSENCSRI
jgi:hypothetical protein